MCPPGRKVGWRTRHRGERAVGGGGGGVGREEFGKGKNEGGERAKGGL